MNKRNLDSKFATQLSTKSSSPVNDKLQMHKQIRDVSKENDSKKSYSESSESTRIFKYELKSERAKLCRKYPQEVRYHEEIINLMRDYERKQHQRVTHHLASWNIRRKNNYLYREQVISYLFEMGAKYGYKRESIYLATTIYDKYALVYAATDGNEVEQIGTTCLFIAGKHAEYIPPNLKKINLQSNQSKILKREGDILNALNFDLNKYTAYDHFQYLVQLYQIPKAEEQFGRFILDHCLFNYKLFAGAKPQILALGILNIICQLMEEEFPHKECYFTRNSIMNCSSAIMKVFNEVYSKFRKVTEKYDPKIKINRYYVNI